MIIEIPDEDSVIKWKYANEDWKSAEISDLIKAYERPSDEVIIAHERIAYERGVADGYAEALEEMKDKERLQGEWLLVGHNDTVNFYKCSICGYEEHDNFTKHYSFCPNCGAQMIKAVKGNE